MLKSSVLCAFGSETLLQIQGRWARQKCKEVSCAPTGNASRRNTPISGCRTDWTSSDNIQTCRSKGKTSLGHYRLLRSSAWEQHQPKHSSEEGCSWILGPPQFSQIRLMCVPEMRPHHSRTPARSASSLSRPWKQKSKQGLQHWGCTATEMVKVGEAGMRQTRNKESYTDTFTLMC